MKKCSKCNLDKTLKDFYRRKLGSRAGEYYEKCRECYKRRGRTYYRNNRQQQLALALLRKRRYKEERRKFIEEYKRNKPCMDCGEIYSSWVMDFDHRDGNTKKGSISHLAIQNTSSFEKIKEEIEKCDLVCANCHRERTYKRMHKDMIAEVANVVKASA